MRTTNGVVGTVTLDSQAAVLLASGGETTAFAVLVNRVDDPVDARIVADDNMVRVNKDNLEVLVGSILVDPVRVEDTEVGANTASALLGNTAQVADELELVDTLVLGLAIDNTLVVRSLAATSADSHAVDNVTLLKHPTCSDRIGIKKKNGSYLLGLVAELVSLIRTSRTSDSLNLLGLTVLPSSDHTMTSQYDKTSITRMIVSEKNFHLPHTKEKAHNIALLLSPQLLKVLVGSHFFWS